MRFVYLIRAGNEYKVGVANDLRKRVSSIQTSNSKKVELICARRSINAQLLEKSIHDHLKKYSGNGGREWFTLTPQKAIEVAIRLNKSPEAETADIIIHDINLDLRKIMLDYWEGIEREMRKGGVLTKPVTVRPIKINTESNIKSDPDEAILSLALETVRTAGSASASMLQRHLSIGYARAARIMDKLEEQGIVSAPDGSHARQVLADSDAVAVAKKMVD